MEPSQSSSHSAVIHLSMPTLGLVGSNGRVESHKRKTDENNGKSPTPCLVAVSALESEDTAEKKDTEGAVVEGEKAAHLAASASDQGLSPKRPRLTTTLLILKKTSSADNNEDYVIANPIELPEGEEMGYASHKKKKKKKKERVVSMSRSNASKLVEIQKSLRKITSKYKPDPHEDHIERRRRTQSASSALYSLNDSAASLKSPPLSAPAVGPISAFSSFKRMSTSSGYRRRQISSGSNIDTSKRRLTRKKRWESEEASGFSTPTSESAKKNHLSENNVWNPIDDYRLLINMVQTKGSLEQVFSGTKFSCFYTLDEAAHRWETLMYDEKAGILSQNAISNLHPMLKHKVQSEALFSEDEEDLLRTVKPLPRGLPELNCFTQLLNANPQVFQYRTPKKMFQHWLDMKKFHLLDGQDVREYKDPFSLFEFRDSAFLATVPDMSVYQELRSESKLIKRQIKQLEEEVESWNCMQELVVSDGTSDLHSIFSVSDFDDQTYAILRGKNVRYCMRSKEILIGRHSTNNKVDADLTLEGASEKVSRRQAIIQLREFGEFFIINQGRHSIFVDHLHVPYGGMAKLNDGCVIQITHIKLIFKINDKLMRQEVLHEVKKEVINSRMTSYDTFAAPGFPPPSALRTSTGLATDPFNSVPSRYSNSRKKHSSATSSPLSGIGHVGVRPGAPRHVIGSQSTSLNNFLPTIADLTIRPSTQPFPMHYPFVADAASKNLYNKHFAGGSPASDNDVFKKPAPVSIIRQGSKHSASRTASPASVINLSSAFVTVGSVLPIPPTTTSIVDATVGSALSFPPATTSSVDVPVGSATTSLPPATTSTVVTTAGLVTPLITTFSTKSSVDVTDGSTTSLPPATTSSVVSSIGSITPLTTFSTQPSSDVANNGSVVPLTSATTSSVDTAAGLATSLAAATGSSTNATVGLTTVAPLAPVTGFSVDATIGSVIPTPLVPDAGSSSDATTGSVTPIPLAPATTSSSDA